MNPRAYRTVEVQSSSPGERIVTLYEHLLVRLKRAEKQIVANDVAGKAESLIKANEIVMALASVLDHEKGGEAGREIATNLENLYLYFSTLIADINRHNDTDKLTSLIKMVSDLHEAWAEAAQLDRSAR